MDLLIDIEYYHMVTTTEYRAWYFSLCGACAPIIREQLVASNRCLIYNSDCDSWTSRHDSKVWANVVVHGRAPIHGPPERDDIGSFSNRSRRHILAEIHSHQKF